MALSLLLLPMAAFAASLPDGIITLDNRTAADFSISDYDGKQYSLHQSRGKWVLLHFWASWCGPCRREMPTIVTLKRQMAGKPIDIILVNTAEDEDTIFSFLGAVAPSLHSYMDRSGALTERWAPRGLPTTFFIDPLGRRRFLALGGRPWDQPAYQAFINGLLRQ
ncbi:MAG: TlpA disulfide reductase family protein [Gammaproteobacteria bacterium]